MNPQSRFAFSPELIVDLFAGAGGASEGIRQAFGRDPDIPLSRFDAVAERLMAYARGDSRPGRPPAATSSGPSWSGATPRPSASRCRPCCTATSSAWRC